MAKIQLEHFKKHETKRGTLIRYIFALLIFVGYITYLVIKFGSDGFSLGIVTWSAFVMATPISDGGLLLDFPMRILTGIRMVYSEIIVWVIAISLNIYFLITEPSIYEKTMISRALSKILLHPWPNWIIVLLSLFGTFLSLYFADELLDIALFKERKKFFQHHHLYYFLILFFCLAVFYIFYKYFLELFGIKI